MKSKLFSLIVSVLAAMCLWVYVMTVVNPDVDLTIGNIPVTFSGAEVLREDHGLVITGDYQEFVSVHFYGKNADLKTLDQHKDELKAVIDVSKVRSTKDYTMSYDITLPSAVSASSITKMDKSPANITFTVERQIRKSVEVRGDFSSVKIAEGYMLDSTSFDFDSITIEGPESVVNTVDHVQITIERSNVDKTITESVPVVLLDKDGAQVDPTQLTLSADAIEVTMKIVKYKVVPIEVQFTEGGGAKLSDLDWDYEPKAVTLSGDSSEVVVKRYADASYCAKDYYEENPSIHEAVDFITGEQMLAVGDAVRLERLSKELIGKDWFMTFPDFDAYVKAREQAYADYEDRQAWAEKMLVNIAMAGYFSSDRTIAEYNKDIWKLDC